MNFLRIRGVVEKTGLSKPTIYRMAGEGAFPKPVKLGPKASGWLVSEVEDWIASRVQARDRRAA